jgi:hypothetical protein
MGLCLICQAAVSSTLKFISEGPQSAVAVAPLATLSPCDTKNDSDAPKPTVRRGSWGKPSWSSVHPKSNDRDRALKRFIGCAPRRERKPFRAIRRMRAVSGRVCE